MTISQKPEKYRFNSVTLALSSIFFTTFSLLTMNSAYAVDASSSNTMTSTAIQPTTAPSSMTGVVSVPASTTTSTTNSASDTKSVPTAATTTSQTTVTTTTNSNAPLNQPNMSDDSILSWAADAAKAAYSYDFKNYSLQMQNNQKFFTSPGWTAFMTALNKSNNLRIVQDKKLVASAVVVGKPTLIKKGVKSGIYFWRVEVPLLATYESESRLIKQNLTVNILITRTNKGNGIGISHFVAAVVPTQPITATTPGATTTSTTTTATPSTTTTDATVPSSTTIYNTTPTTTTSPATTTDTTNTTVTTPTPATNVPRTTTGTTGITPSTTDTTSIPPGAPPTTSTPGAVPTSPTGTPTTTTTGPSSPGTGISAPSAPAQ